MLAVLGASLGGFLLGMFMFGTDRQGHSIAFLVLSILALFTMVGLQSFQIYNNKMNSVIQPVDWAK